MNMIKRGLAMARDKLKKHASDKFVYVRGECESEPFDAVKSATTVDVFEDGALVGRVRRIEFLLDPLDLLLDGSPVRPRDDDRLYELDDDETRIAAFRVSSPSETEPPWIGTDPHDTLLRTYTVRDKL